MPNISTEDPPDNSKLVAAFEALCWSRAYRYGQGELKLLEAVDWLQDWAFTRGLTEHPGHDAVQLIITNAFAPYRETPQ